MPELTFEMFRDEADEWRWRCKSSNGEIIADCGEGYADKGDCRHGIDLIRSEASDATIETIEATH